MSVIVRSQKERVCSASRHRQRAQSRHATRSSLRLILSFHGGRLQSRLVERPVRDLSFWNMFLKKSKLCISIRHLSQSTIQCVHGSMHTLVACVNARQAASPSKMPLKILRAKKNVRIENHATRDCRSRGTVLMRATGAQSSEVAMTPFFNAAIGFRGLRKPLVISF